MHPCRPPEGGGGGGGGVFVVCRWSAFCSVKTLYVQKMCYLLLEGGGGGGGGGGGAGGGGGGRARCFTCAFTVRLPRARGVLLLLYRARYVVDGLYRCAATAFLYLYRYAAPYLYRCYRARARALRLPARWAALVVLPLRYRYTVVKE